MVAPIASALPGMKRWNERTVIESAAPGSWALATVTRISSSPGMSGLKPDL